MLSGMSVTKSSFLEHCAPSAVHRIMNFQQRLTTVNTIVLWSEFRLIFPYLNLLGPYTPTILNFTSGLAKPKHCSLPFLLEVLLSEHPLVLAKLGLKVSAVGVKTKDAFQREDTNVRSASLYVFKGTRPVSKGVKSAEERHPFQGRHLDRTYGTSLLLNIQLSIAKAFPVAVHQLHSGMRTPLLRFIKLIRRRCANHFSDSDALICFYIRSPSN